MKLKKEQILHIVIIIIGTIFLLIPAFHSNVWFDESYSVAMANHSFVDIWKIGSNDVHPILYYFILHIINLIFGCNIIAYRLFSALCIIILAILGYTHIRKDFGEKVGLIFSFLSIFLPGIALYAGEIRMYSMGLMLGTVMLIYANRIYNNKINKTTFIIFGLSSLALAYTHYYGLMLAGIVNILVFINLLKNYKTRKQDFIKFVITAFFQIIIYIPWLLSFITQIKGVSSGFWITLTFPNTLYEVLTAQFKGNMEMIPAVVLTILLFAYLIYTYISSKRKNENMKESSVCIAIYISIIIIALLVSLCMQSVILLYRYLIIITGLLIFAISYIMSKEKRNYITIIICICILIISSYSMVLTVKEVYNKNNNECINYIKENIKENDIIVYSNVINGAVITVQINDNTSYFYNKDNWGIHEAYKAFSPNMKIKDTLEEILDDYEGRIWLIESEKTYELCDEILSKYQINKIEEKQFKSEYKDYRYTIELIQK